MKQFIDVVRNNRRQEIEKYIAKGYYCHEDGKYTFIDSITVRNEEDVKIGIEVTEREVFFYVIDEGVNSYYSIIEMYNLFIDMCFREGTDFVISKLQEQLANNYSEEKGSSIIYDNNEYSIHKIVTVQDKGSIMPSDSSLELQYQHLFVLLNLIQEKSNALFSMGKEKEYINGVLRLLIVLLSCDRDNPVLREMGWNYKKSDCKFIFEKPVLETKRSIRKYYLTEEEYQYILKKES